MAKVKVWLGGEGPSEIGDRDIGGERVGAIEALLLRVEPEGWKIDGATKWRQIRKLKVGAALGADNHGDIHSIAGLVNQAYEAGSEVVAFSRDVDAERDTRGDAIERGIALARGLSPTVAIIGGAAYPAIEGWILALLGVRDADAMSRDRANRDLAAAGLDGKRAEDYVDAIERAEVDALPIGCDSLRTWLERARSVLGAAIRGT